MLAQFTLDPDDHARESRPHTFIFEKKIIMRTTYLHIHSYESAWLRRRNPRRKVRTDNKNNRSAKRTFYHFLVSLFTCVVARENRLAINVATAHLENAPTPFGLLLLLRSSFTLRRRWTGELIFGRRPGSLQKHHANFQQLGIFQLLLSL